MLAAVYLGLPTVIHEQNAVLGRANRLLAPRVRRIATVFPVAQRGCALPTARSAVHTGNPVRGAMLAVGHTKYKPPQRGGEIELSILGGSQGARIMSEVVPPALAALPSAIARDVAGRSSGPSRRISRAQRRFTGETESKRSCRAFLSDVPERLARAQLAICRAGASTIAELAAIGRPALLIPYPHAMDDHQTANARASPRLAAAGSYRKAELRPDTLALYLENLLGDPPALGQAASRASEFRPARCTQRSWPSWRSNPVLAGDHRGARHEGSSPLDRTHSFRRNRRDWHERHCRGVA